MNAPFWWQEPVTQRERENIGMLATAQLIAALSYCADTELETPYAEALRAEIDTRRRKCSQA